MLEKSDCQKAFEVYAKKECMDLSPNLYGMRTYNRIYTEYSYQIFKAGWEAGILKFSAELQEDLC